jgi:hypothetical protein
MWHGYEDPEWYEENDSDGEQEKSCFHPVKRYSLEIFKLTKALAGSLDEARKALYGQHLLQFSKCLFTQFLRAEETENYIEKMEAAVMMKISVRQLLEYIEVLEKDQTHPLEHFQLLKNNISDLKKAFVIWIKMFDPQKKSPDGWGIFE